MKSCLVCASNKFEPLYDSRLLRCTSCGFVTANIDITSEMIQQTYTEKYFNGEEFVDYLGDKEILQTNFEKRLRYIYRHIDKSTITDVMEIGCAYGFFAEIITSDLKNIHYLGYDIVPEVVEYASKKLKQNVVCGNFLEAQLEHEISDLFMWDVIEHLPHPEKFVEKAAAELKAGGRIYITTGDIDRFIPRIQKARWRMIHPPTHIHYFSKRTLSMLLEKKGFKIISVSYPPVARSLRIIYYSLFMLRKRYPRFVEKIYNIIPKKMNIAINTYDILFLIAEKK